MPQYFTVQPRPLIAAGDPEFLDVGGEALGLVAIPKHATHAILAFEAANIRWLVGANPTTDLGIPQNAGDYLEWLEPAIDYATILQDIRFISSGLARVTVQYFMFKDVP